MATGDTLSLVGRSGSRTTSGEMETSRGTHVLESGRSRPSVVLIAHRDDAARTLYVENALFFTDARVLEASNGRDAIDKMRRHRPHTALLSLELPELDGWSSIRALRRDPMTREVRIVVLLPGEDGDHHQLAGEAGVQVVIEQALRADVVGQMKLAIGAQRDA